MLQTYFYYCIWDFRTIQTNTYILTFNRLQLPSVIDMGYLRVRVEKYIPSPLRCAKFQKFGHHFSKCRNSTAICCRCGSPQSEMSLNQRKNVTTVTKNMQLLPNLQNVSIAKNLIQHSIPAFSKQCPKYKQEQQIITLKCALNICFPEARVFLTFSFWNEF